MHNIAGCQAIAEFQGCYADKKISKGYSYAVRGVLTVDLTSL